MVVGAWLDRQPNSDVTLLTSGFVGVSIWCLFGDPGVHFGHLGFHFHYIVADFWLLQRAAKHLPLGL